MSTETMGIRATFTVAVRMLYGAFTSTVDDDDDGSVTDSAERKDTVIEKIWLEGGGWLER